MRGHGSSELHAPTLSRRSGPSCGAQLRQLLCRELAYSIRGPGDHEDTLLNKMRFDCTVGSRYERRPALAAFHQPWSASGPDDRRPTVKRRLWFRASWRRAAAAAATITFCSSAINSPSSVVRIFRTKPSTTPWAACAERPLAGSRLSLLQEDETAKTI